MKIRPRRVKSEPGKKRELLREFFLNAISMALLKEAVLVPIRVEARRSELPAYYRG